MISSEVFRPSDQTDLIKERRLAADPAQHAVSPRAAAGRTCDIGRARLRRRRGERVSAGHAEAVEDFVTVAMREVLVASYDGRVAGSQPRARPVRGPGSDDLVREIAGGRDAGLRGHGRAGSRPPGQPGCGRRPGRRRRADLVGGPDGRHTSYRPPVSGKHSGLRATWGAERSRLAGASDPLPGMWQRRDGKIWAARAVPDMRGGGTPGPGSLPASPSQRPPSRPWPLPPLTATHHCELAPYGLTGRETAHPNQTGNLSSYTWTKTWAAWIRPSTSMPNPWPSKKGSVTSPA